MQFFLELQPQNQFFFLLRIPFKNWPTSQNWRQYNNGEKRLSRNYILYCCFYFLLYLLLLNVFMEWISALFPLISIFALRIIEHQVISIKEIHKEFGMFRPCTFQPQPPFPPKNNLLISKKKEKRVLFYPMKGLYRFFYNCI